MPAWPQLLPFALLGVLGSLHCAGMCGPFSVTVCARASGRRSGALHLGAYVLGKALTYALLGLGVALASHLAADLLPSLERGRALLAWLVGLALIAGGLAWLGLRPPRALTASLRGAAPVRWPVRWIGRVWSTARAVPGPGGSFGIGFLTGFLPCGLSWSALLLASQVEPPVAVAGPFLFGLATAPALVLTGAAGRVLVDRLGRRAQRLLGPALVLIGVVTVLRGGLPGGDEPGASCPWCEHPPSLQDEGAH